MKKVLILEDEVNIRSFVVINLKRAGYDAIEAGTGREALEKINTYPDIGVAILDIMLPDIDGFEVRLPKNEMFARFDLTVDQSGDIQKVETNQ